MAVDLVELPGAAAMRANDEMQQTTIGGDSDADGSDRPRARARRGLQTGRRARQRARSKQPAAPAVDGGGTGEAAGRNGSDDSDRD